MATHAGAGVHAHTAPTGFLWKYIFSLDHKVIGIQYYFLALFSVFVGMALSLLMRFHLVWPAAKVPFIAGGIMKPEQYLALVTMHGTIMVFMVLTTAPQSGFGNYFLPIEIGAEDMAFPVLNMLSFWTTFVSLVVILAAFFVEGGAPIGGWTSYPPLSAVGDVAGPGQGAGQTLWVIGLAIFCLASLIGALNFITTTVDLRCKGMSLMRMPLTVWAWLVTAILGLLAFGVLLAACGLLLLDRLAGTSFFIPGGLVFTDTVLTSHDGGSPLLWQHLFWFFGHPEVYIAILPGMGVTSHVLSNFSRKPVFGYKAMVGAICAIGFLGFCVWGHHMFVSGMSPYSAFAFSLLTMTIGVPSAIKTFNWLGTLWGGKITFTCAMLFALGFVSLFVTGGLSGLFLAQPTLDLYFHDTFFVVAHFHFVMGVAARRTRAERTAEIRKVPDCEGSGELCMVHLPTQVGRAGARKDPPVFGPACQWVRALGVSLAAAPSALPAGHRFAPAGLPLAPAPWPARRRSDSAPSGSADRLSGRQGRRWPAVWRFAPAVRRYLRWSSFAARSSVPARLQFAPVRHRRPAHKRRLRSSGETTPEEPWWLLLWFSSPTSCFLSLLSTYRNRGS